MAGIQGDAGLAVYQKIKYRDPQIRGEDAAVSKNFDETSVFWWEVPWHLGQEQP